MIHVCEKSQFAHHVPKVVTPLLKLIYQLFHTVPTVIVAVFGNCTFQFTSNFANGLVVPIQTLPPLVILIFSDNNAQFAELLNVRSKLLVVHCLSVQILHTDHEVHHGNHPDHQNLQSIHIAFTHAFQISSKVIIELYHVDNDFATAKDVVGAVVQIQTLPVFALITSEVTELPPPEIQIS